jgi:excisionase family DNA binding protein
MENPFDLILNRLGFIEDKLRHLHTSPPTPAAAEADELLTTKETASLLKVSTVTVWDWQKRGILTKHTVGNQVRYLRSEVLAAVLKKQGPPLTDEPVVNYGPTRPARRAAASKQVAA